MNGGSSPNDVPYVTHFGEASPRQAINSIMACRGPALRNDVHMEHHLKVANLTSLYCTRPEMH